MPLLRVQITHVPVDRETVRGTADLLRDLADEVERRAYGPGGDGATSPACVGCGLKPGEGHGNLCRIGLLIRQARERQQEFEREEARLGL